MAGDMGLVSFNVGGTVYTISEKTLLNYPESKLGRFAAGSDQERASIANHVLNGTYFFDRSSFTFDAILNFYRDGELHLPDIKCPETFVKDLEFWQIDLRNLGTCCESKFESMLKKARKRAAKQMENGTIENYQPVDGERRMGVVDVEEQEHRNQKCGIVRHRVWMFLENPASSKGAILFSTISMSMIALTVMILVGSSMETFQYHDEINNSTEVVPALDIADAVCVAFFSFEYLLRLWACPHTWEYVKAPLSIIDMVAVAPFYFEATLNTIGYESKIFGDLRRSLLLVRILRVLRVLRVLRILKVARYSTGFRSMGQTLKRSYKELILLVLFMTSANVIFSTLMYFLENEQPYTKFKSIPDAMWCYGDIYPTSPTGKILAGIVSISGVILLAFPISVIVENFNQDYEKKGDGNKEEEEEEVPEAEPAFNEDGEPIQQQTVMFVPVRKRRRGGGLF